MRAGKSYGGWNKIFMRSHERGAIVILSNLSRRPRPRLMAETPAQAQVNVMLVDERGLRSTDLPIDVTFRARGVRRMPLRLHKG